MLIDTEIGYVNVAHIIRADGKLDGGSVIYMTDGKFTTSRLSADEVADLAGPVVPNTVGIQAVFFYEEEDGTVGYGLETIVAWRVPVGTPIPIRADGMDVDYLLHPNGRVEHIYVATFDSLASAAEDYAQRNGLKMPMDGIRAPV